MMIAKACGVQATRLLLGIFMLGVMAMTGCRQDGPELGTVSGMVTLDGQPLVNARILFQPLSSGRASFGVTDERGFYEIGYSIDHKGAMVGSHKVSITTAALLDRPDGSSTAVPEKLPARYHQETELKHDVGSGKNQIDFALQSK